jgi:hypothetical protein
VQLLEDVSLLRRRLKSLCELHTFRCRVDRITTDFAIRWRLICRTEAIHARTALVGIGVTWCLRLGQGCRMVDALVRFVTLCTPSRVSSKSVSIQNQCIYLPQVGIMWSHRSLPLRQGSHACSFPLRRKLVFCRLSSCDTRRRAGNKLPVYVQSARIQTMSGFEVP